MNDLVRRSEILFGLNVFSDDENGNEHFLNGIETAKEIVEDARAVDAVPVVRCKDCKYYVTDFFVKTISFPVPIIAAHEVCCFNKDNPIKVNDMHYCSWGEKR